MLRLFSSPVRLLRTFSTFKKDDYIDIIDKKYSGKLIIIPTPIGNMEDMSINMYSALMQVDVIACEDTRVAGSLYRLMENRKLLDKFQESFGYCPNGKELVINNNNTEGRAESQEASGEQSSENYTSRLFEDYHRMNQKERKKFLLKMEKSQQQRFRKQFLAYRAKKLLRSKDDVWTKTPEQESLYGLDCPEPSLMELHIHETRAKKGRGMMIALNTYSQTSLFKLVQKLVEDYKVGLVADAGTPCISDPGFKLVNFLKEKAPKLQIETVKGPSSVAVMATLASLTQKTPAASTTNKNQITPTSHYRLLSGCFQGFSDVPSRFPEQADWIVHGRDYFHIFFENVHRLSRTLSYVEKLCGAQQKIYVAGEISKKFEKRYNGSTYKLREYLAEQREAVKGEISFMLYPAGQVQTSDQQAKLPPLRTKVKVDPAYLVSVLNENVELSNQEMAVVVKKLLNISKNQAMKHVIDIKTPPQWKKQKKESNV